MKEIIFFDFDYTLARTVENVMLWSLEVPLNIKTTVIFY